MAALFIGLMALMPVQAITQEEMVYDQVSKYIRGSEAAAIAKDICDASYTYDVDPILVAAVFTTESHFDNSAVSGVGAVGIAQLMPSTAASLKVNPYNRRENILWRRQVPRPDGRTLPHMGPALCLCRSGV